MAFVLDQQEGRRIRFGDIKQISISKSNDWASRSINFHLSSDNETVCILTDDEEYNMDHLQASPELAVMIMTEWLVKAAGACALQLVKCGYQAPLFLRKLLTADGNPMVRKRNEHCKRHAQSQKD